MCKKNGTLSASMFTKLETASHPFKRCVEHPAALFLLFFGVALLVRLPHYLSRHFYFDGDEAIVGIMAQDWLSGRAFPLYFYGQNYGFCLLETWSVGLWIKILGTGIWALRLGGLTLFSIGTVFFFLGLKKRHASQYLPWLFAFLLLTFPPWILYAGMTRGGYVQGYLLLGLLFYLLSENSLDWKRTLLLGVVGGAMIESQKILLAPFLVLFFVDIWDRSNRIRIFGWAAIAAVSTILLLKMFNFYYNGWGQPNLYFVWKLFWEYFGFNFSKIVPIYGSFYFYNAFFEIPTWWKLGLTLCLLLLVVLLFMQLKKWPAWKTLLFGTGILLTYCFTGVFGVYAPRYLLGLYLALLVVVFYHPVNRWTWILLLGMALLQTIGIGAGSKLRREWYPNNMNQMQALEELHQYATNKGVKALFFTDNLGQWSWNYLYGDEIPACAFRRKERMMRFTREAYRVHDTHPEDIAFTGLWGIFWGMDSLQGFNDHRYQLNEKFYWMDHNVEKYLKRGEKTAR